MLLITVLVVLGMLTLGAAYVSAKGKDGQVTPGSNVAWENAIANEKSQVGQILLRTARPLAKIPQIHDASTSPQYRGLQNKLLGSGTYGGSVEVFLSVQALAVFVSLLVLAALFTSQVSGLVLFAGIILAVAFAALPWNLVSQKAKAREKAVAEGLPMFAELLLMPLESGMTVMSALAFTADRQTGPVAEEVRNLRTVINSRAMDEAEAFKLAAARLGTPAAMSFFTALMQAHLEGAKVIQNLQSQAQALRDEAHQRSRGELKKLPVKLVIIIALHLLPVLFVAALLPTFISLGSL